MNAVVDALSGLGVHDIDTPVSPNPASPMNVWHAIQAARTTNNDGGSQ
jgi:hypothetical protein